MPWVRHGHINPPRKGGASHAHTQSVPEGVITLCAAAALARGGGDDDGGDGYDGDKL